jgi:cardiolipin synthase
LVFIPFIAMTIVDRRYGLALGLLLLAGLTDGLDGLLARKMDQRTVLGQYLDPIADKLLLSTLFLVLASIHQVPWRLTILVFSRDFGILLVSLLLYITTPLRDYSPSFLGKANTAAQIITVLLVFVDEITRPEWVTYLKVVGFWTVAVLTLLSGLHYIVLVGQRLRALPKS